MLVKLPSREVGGPSPSARFSMKRPPHPLVPGGTSSSTRLAPPSRRHGQGRHATSPGSEYTGAVGRREALLVRATTASPAGGRGGGRQALQA